MQDGVKDGIIYCAHCKACIIECRCDLPDDVLNGRESLLDYDCEECDYKHDNKKCYEKTV